MLVTGIGRLTGHVVLGLRQSGSVVKVSCSRAGWVLNEMFEMRGGGRGKSNFADRTLTFNAQSINI